jgi:hypothetical protein
MDALLGTELPRRAGEHGTVAMKLATAIVISCVRHGCSARENSERWNALALKESRSLRRGRSSKGRPYLSVMIPVRR